MEFDDRNWSKSAFGKFVDEKIGYYKFPNTLIILGEWKHQKENLKALTMVGETHWFSVISPDVPDLQENYIDLYYIKINNEEHKELALQIFKEYARAFYARYYEGMEAVEAYGKKIEE